MPTSQSPDDDGTCQTTARTGSISPARHLPEIARAHALGAAVRVQDRARGAPVTGSSSLDRSQDRGRPHRERLPEDHVRQRRAAVCSTAVARVRDVLARRSRPPGPGNGLQRRRVQPRDSRRSAPATATAARRQPPRHATTQAPIARRLHLISLPLLRQSHAVRPRARGGVSWQRRTLACASRTRRRRPGRGRRRGYHARPGRRGRVVRQRPAKPRTAVRIRSSPLRGRPRTGERPRKGLGHAPLLGRGSAGEDKSAWSRSSSGP